MTTNNACFWGYLIPLCRLIFFFSSDTIFFFLSKKDLLTFFVSTSVLVIVYICEDKYKKVIF